MKVYIKKYGDLTETDITDYVIYDHDIIINKEHERDAFERTVGDVNLVLSNIDGTLTNIFKTISANDKYIIRIIEPSTTIFIGQIDNTSIEFDLTNETITFDVFSSDKIFWDRCKETKINHNFSDTDAGLSKTFLSYMLDFNLTWPGRFNDLFERIDYYDKYKDASLYPYGFMDKYVRWVKIKDTWAISHSNANNEISICGNHDLQNNDYVYIYGHQGSEPDINGKRKVVLHDTTWFKIDVDIIKGGTGGLVTKLPIENINGRYADLAPDTTVYDLLKAVEIWFNAEFILDYEARLLIMKKRQTPINTSVDTLDNKLLTDSATVKIIDSKKYDYIYTIYEHITAPTPELIKQELIEDNTNVGFANPDLNFSHYIKYYTTIWINGVESSPSEPLTLVVNNTQYLAGVNLFFGIVPTIRIPAGIEGTEKRTVYRTWYGGGGGDTYGKVYKWYEIENNDATEIQDFYIFCNFNVPLPENKPIITSAWLGYDEASGQWNIIIKDTQGGKNEPEGNIFNAIPELRFVNPNAREELVETTNYDIFCFFNKDHSFEEIKNCWIDLFKRKSLVSIKATGIDYKDDRLVGLPSMQNIIDKNVYLIKRASINLNNEITELELVNI